MKERKRGAVNNENVPSDDGERRARKKTEYVGREKGREKQKTKDERWDGGRRERAGGRGRKR